MLSSTHPPTSWGRRWFRHGSVLYVVVVAIAADRAREPGAWWAGLLALTVSLLSARYVRGVALWAGWGLAMVIASMGAVATNRELDTWGAAGVLACVVAAIVAAARMPLDGGLAEPKIHSPIPILILPTALWWTVLVAGVSLFHGGLGWLGSMTHDLRWGAILASAASLVVSNEWVARLRRLELSGVERTRATRAFLATVVAVTAIVAVIAVDGAQPLAMLSLAIASVGVTAIAMAPDAVRVARAVRRMVALSIVGGGVALIGTAAAQNRGDAGLIVLATGAAALAVGSAAARFESPLRPVGGAWLDAFERAAAAATRADADEALREALVALQTPIGLGAPTHELWTFPPTIALSVDAAGYLHEREAQLPETLVLVAAAEAHGTLRSAVLDALEVRRPDLRPLGAWMRVRASLMAVVVASDSEIDGLLVLAAGLRSEPLTLEEVKAAKRAADALATACRARAMTRRMLSRVREADARAGAAEKTVASLEAERDLETMRHGRAASRWALSANLGAYSAASRMGRDALERCTASPEPFAVVAASGVASVPHVARAHLMGARRDGPFVVVDGTDPRESTISRWDDPRASPLALAHRGLLVLADGAALSSEVQDLIARVHIEGRAPWDVATALDVQLALTAVLAPADLVARGRLTPALGARFARGGAPPVHLPSIRERPEDFRALLTERLAREGLRQWGHPVGIEPAAYMRLAEYEFPGDDLELDDVVHRLVAGCTGDRIRVADVASFGLAGAPPQPLNALSQPGNLRPKKDPSSA